MKQKQLKLERELKNSIEILTLVWLTVKTKRDKKEQVITDLKKELVHLEQKLTTLKATKSFIMLVFFLGWGDPLANKTFATLNKHNP